MNTTTNPAPIDVLAVLRRRARNATGAPQWEAYIVLDAVAELIAAAEMVAAPEHYESAQVMHALRAALARVQGGTK